MGPRAMAVWALALGSVCGAPAAAQALDGLYWQRGLVGAAACNGVPGTDGGPARISGAVFENGGNGCRFSGLRQEGNALRGTLTCDGEGEPFDSDIRLSGTADGFRLENLSFGVTSDFVRC